MRRQLCIIIVNDASDEFSVSNINIEVYCWFLVSHFDECPLFLEIVMRLLFVWCQEKRHIKIPLDLNETLPLLVAWINSWAFFFHFKVIITICSNLMIESIHWKPKYNDFNRSVINEYDWGGDYKETTCIFFIKINFLFAMIISWRWEDDRSTK